MLTPTAWRMVVASTVRAANSAVDGLLVADALDATAAGILRVSGVDDDAIARVVMSWLWRPGDAVAATRTDVGAARTIKPSERSPGLGVSPGLRSGGAGIKSGMKSYPSSETVLDGLGDKIVSGLSRTVVLAARDLRPYRLTFPQWVSQSSERGLANWIHDRIWWHVTVVFDSMPGVEVSDREPTREITVGLNYRLRLKRHHEDGDVSSYPTPTALEFYFQGVQQAFPGMDEVRLAAGYEWDKETREMGAAVLSLRDGRENIVWKVTLPAVDDGLGGVTVPTVPGPTPPTIQGPTVEGKRVKDQE